MDHVQQVVSEVRRRIERDTALLSALQEAFPQGELAAVPFGLPPVVVTYPRGGITPKEGGKKRVATKGHKGEKGEEPQRHRGTEGKGTKVSFRNVLKGVVGTIKPGQVFTKAALGELIPKGVVIPEDGLAKELWWLQRDKVIELVSKCYGNNSYRRVGPVKEAEGRGQRTEGRGQRAEDGEQKAAPKKVAVRGTVEKKVAVPVDVRPAGAPAAPVDCATAMRKAILGLGNEFTFPEVKQAVLSQQGADVLMRWTDSGALATQLQRWRDEGVVELTRRDSESKMAYYRTGEGFPGN